MDKGIPRGNGPACRLKSGSVNRYADRLKLELIERGYSSQTVGRYVSGLAHFGQWLARQRQPLRRVNEDAIAQFLHHLPRCRCAGRVVSVRGDLSAALHHLLALLRRMGVVAEIPEKTNAVDEELKRFDEHMNHVRGLAPTTRRLVVRIVGLLLRQRFGDGSVVISDIKPWHVRRFFAEQSTHYCTPAVASVVVSALRGYFRFRSSCGDATHALIGAVPFPANWRLTSLPKALAQEEIDQLLLTLDRPGRSMRRALAIVRCALDLGLRSGEVASLKLDDIDWRAATIRLRHTKNRHDDVLPLPLATGRAIAAYLQHERPVTANRAVFVRHIAPRDEPFGVDGVRKVIARSYGRAGLRHTRSHLLRHTMASRLLAGGSSLKEVADLLRHRSLNSTQIYAKLDSRNLEAVALPWPGDAS